MGAVTVDNKQLTTSTATNRDGIHKVNLNFESDAKLTSVVRRLEALELSKGVQSSTLEPSKPVVSPVCVIYDTQDHLVAQLPGFDPRQWRQKLFAFQSS